MVKHIRTHTDERPFKCQICPYASRNSSQLVVHLRTHTGDAPFRCSECTAAFKINSDLKRHMRMHSGEKPYACEQCDYRSAIKGNLTNHIKLNHSDNRKLTCDQCDFTASSKKLLKEHIREHITKAFRCTNCTYTTSSCSALKNHIRIHTNEKPYDCSICRYSCRQACNLRTHIKKKHPDYEISSPKKKRKNNKEKISIKKDQSPKKIKGRGYCHQLYNCNLCDCSFVREDSLRSHLRHHQNVTPQEEGALAILQLQKESCIINDTAENTQVEKINENLIEAIPQDAEFEITSELVVTEGDKLTSNENIISVHSQLYQKLMEGRNLEESQQTVTRRGRPPKKVVEKTQHILPNEIRFVTQNSGQVIYQLPSSSLSFIPVSSNDNNTVLIINNAISTQEFTEELVTETVTSQ